MNKRVVLSGFCFGEKEKSRDLHFGGRRRVEKIFKVGRLLDLIFRIMEKNSVLDFFFFFFFFLLAKIFGLEIVFFFFK